MVQPVFDSPVVSDELEQALWLISLRHEDIVAPGVEDVLADLEMGEDRVASDGRTFERQSLEHRQRRGDFVGVRPNGEVADRRTEPVCEGRQDMQPIAIVTPAVPSALPSMAMWPEEALLQVVESGAVAAAAETEVQAANRRDQVGESRTSSRLPVTTPIDHLFGRTPPRCQAEV